MTSMIRRVASWPAAALVATASCFDVPFITETFADAIEVHSLAGPITVGDTARLNVSALYIVAESDRGPQPRRSSLVHPDDYEFLALDPAIATIDALGIVRTFAEGTADFSIRYKHVTDTTSLQVVPLVNEIRLSATADTIVGFGNSISFDAIAVDAQDQPLSFIPYAASVDGSHPKPGVTIAPVSATVTRFTVSANGGVQYTITVRATNARSDRERTATFSLYIDG